MACISRFDGARGLFGACARRKVCYSECVGRRGKNTRAARTSCPVVLREESALYPWRHIKQTETLPLHPQARR